MASKQSEKQQGIPIELPSKGFSKSMLFNRFAVEDENDFRIIYFGYCSRSNVTIDQFACAVLKSDLQHQKEINLDYLGKLGTLPLEEPPQWQPQLTKQNIELVNQISLCRFGETAEIMLHVFPVKAVLDASRMKIPEKVTGTAVALLRSNLDLHKHFVRIIYDF